MHVRALLSAAAAAVLVAGVVSSARARNLNDLLPHEYVATLNAKHELSGARSGGLAVLAASLDQQPHVHDATRPFKPGDPLAWRIAFTGLSSPVTTITMHKAVPGRAGPTLITLCRACKSGARGTLLLNGSLAIELDQAPICYVDSPCSRAEPEQFSVYVEIATTHHPRGEIRGQLRFSGRVSPRLELAKLVAASASTAPSRDVLPYPNSIAAIGDSWTAPYCTRSDCTVHPNDSWSTGSNPAIDSHYLRILAGNPAIRGHTFNIAGQRYLQGPGVGDLVAQAKLAVATHADYVTIALGENNVCDGTTPARFRAEFASGLNELSRGLPTASIFVASIDDLTQQWHVLKAYGKVGPYVTLDCGVGAGASAAHLTAVRARISTLNQQLAQACRRYARCRYDGGAVFRAAWKAADFSPKDYGHLSIEGQRRLAAITWNATFHFTR